jgi:hypothetical protein
VLPDLVTMRRSVKKRPQDEHVKRSLEEPDPLLCLFHHRRHSTLASEVMVDNRLSIVKGAAESGFSADENSQYGVTGADAPTVGKL